MPRSTRRAPRPPAAKSASFALRRQLIGAVKARIARMNLSQAQAAELLGITAPRLSLLVHGHAALFSVDALVDLAARSGLKVRLRVTRPYGAG